MGDQTKEPLEDWTGQKTWPDQLREGSNSTSVDVLCYCPHLKEHTIGWFDFNQMRWAFLCREPFNSFEWRYFDPITDTPKT